MLVFDLGVMIVLVKMIKQSGISPPRLLLYAANPLILLYLSGEGHLDVIQVFFLCLALYLILYRRYHVVGFLMLGVAILSKYLAFIVLPFWVNAGNRIKSLAVLIPLVLYIPFLDAGTGIFKSLSLFYENFHYNDSITVFIRFFFADTQMLISSCLLFICLLWVYLFVQNPLRSTYLALGCLLLFLPTLHPWYLVIITPFLVYFSSRAWLYLQLAVVFTFPAVAVEYHTGVFQEIQWLKKTRYGMRT